MEKRNSNGYIYIGTSMRYLMDISEGHLIFHERSIAHSIRALSDLLERYKFHVTKRMFLHVEEMLRKWEEEVWLNVDDSMPDDVDSVDKDTLEKKSGRAITAEEVGVLIRYAGIAREGLLAEATGIVNYVASDKRYTVQKLTEDISSLMAENVFGTLPEIAQIDFREAGKCIAYELPTSAAFHLMRGTEAVVRHYYFTKVRRNRINKPYLWGPMTDHLKTKRTPDGLIESLDNIRRNYRNPTQHPDKVYDLDEAQDLLSLSLDVTNRMMRDIQ